MSADKNTDIEQAMAAFEDIMKYRGRLPAKFDADKEPTVAKEVLVDTNILMDVIADRKPYDEYGKDILEM